MIVDCWWSLFWSLMPMSGTNCHIFSVHTSFLQSHNCSCPRLPVLPVKRCTSNDLIVFITHFLLLFFCFIVILFVSTSVLDRRPQPAGADGRCRKVQNARRVWRHRQRSNDRLQPDTRRIGRRGRRTVVDRTLVPNLGVSYPNWVMGWGLLIWVTGCFFY